MSLVVGLTGSIGMGKSTVAGMFRTRGIPVYDADAAVHKLYGADSPTAVAIASVFPNAIAPDGSVDRERLKADVLHDSSRLGELERIVYPAVAADRQVFLRQHVGATIIVLEIPLLFETGTERACDVVIVVSASASVQRARVLKRPGMTEVQFERLLEKQMPDCEKRSRADFIIDTDQSLEDVDRQVDVILAAIARHPDNTPTDDRS